MLFRKLRLAGFKSFVEPAELSIDQGLTGIVGPNGCGKSNLVEALRWVMGESSARQLRGDEMDDVIFGGTASRPPRSVAEVTLQVDQEQNESTAPHDERLDMEVSRRITRGGGSVYRVNGREVRARDVQLLFADAAAGARSAAIVSQGQIGTLISGKPEQRRAILEEAAGITGLHARRQEAEQRLNAAELNLSRVDDILATLDAQLQNLRKQARQASRYKSLAERLRRTEASLFRAKWQKLEASLAEAGRAQLAGEAAVEVAAREAAAATAAHSRALDPLPGLRRRESATATELQRVQLELEMLEAEERRAADEKRASAARLDQIRRDLERESSRGSDAATALQRLEEERASIKDAQSGEEATRTDLATRLRGFEQEVASLETRAAQLAEEVARTEAARAALLRQIKDAEARLDNLQRQRERLARDRSAAAASAVEATVLEAAERNAAAAEASVIASAAAAEAATEAAARTRDAEVAAREATQQHEMEVARLRSEERALAGLLTTDKPRSWAPILDSVTVDPGFEAAVGIALGDDLTAGTSPDAAIHWRALDPYDPPHPLPAGAEPLAPHVAAPPALARRLDQIGVVADAIAGAELSARLSPGQRLVTRDGALWRWDGLTATSGRVTETATRLTHRNRLNALRAQLPALEKALTEARAARDAAIAGTREAAANEKTARETSREAQTAVAQRRQELAQLSQRAAVFASQIAAITESEQRVAAELKAAEDAVAALRDSLAGLPDTVAGRTQADSLRARLSEGKKALLDARSQHDRNERDAAARARRLEAIEAELDSWAERRGDADAHIGDLRNRASAEEQMLANLTARPEQADSRRIGLDEQVAMARHARKCAVEDLAAAEALAGERQRHLKEVEATLASAREARIRTEANLENSRSAAAALEIEIEERFERSPAALSEICDDEAAETEALEQRFTRLQRERDAVGPVNLRAEVEIETTTQEIADINTQRDDLTAAIAKLRAGIGELNREARGRLTAAFEEVDRHFRSLFTRLFGGGRAELILTNPEDPLAAGLEILASPPGKRLENLSLLSGGERALAALSLILAVFLTQPAPVCVLDEVDAPLDDANVDRFCSLIEEIAETTGTRFLVITHHQLTMARMHRLFGVTMAERGISQLVSVDLRLAQEMRATA